MIHINFNPLNNITSHKTLIYPIAPGELWVATIDAPYDIYSATTQARLDEKEDDQGLYYRLREGLDNKTLQYLHILKVRYMLIGCSPKQDEAPECSNIFNVYDFYLSDGKVLNAHLADKCCYINKFSRPPYLVKSLQKAMEIYLDEPDLLFWGRSKFPRPILVRSFDADQPVYKLMDPYLQWSPPRFWHQEDRMQSIPTDLEGWIDEIIKSFNWEYFYHLVHNDGQPLAEPKHLIAALFDVIYDEYLYYGLCSKLFVQGEKKDPHPQLLGAKKNHVLVNFTDIVNSIQETIHQRLLDKVDVEPDVLLKDSNNSSDKLTETFNQMFNQMELET